MGSFETVTDGSGQVREKLSFDPWGRRRNATDWRIQQRSCKLR